MTHVSHPHQKMTMQAMRAPAVAQRTAIRYPVE